MAAFGFQNQLDIGKQGEELVVDYFRHKRGHWEVVDVRDVAEWRRRDVDYLINGRMCEVKSDLHTTGNIFLETSVGSKPGCVFMSRAELWLYVFPQQGDFFLIELPKLQHWVYQYGRKYPAKRVRSKEGKRSWVAEGIAVPLSELEKAGCCHRFQLEGGYVEPDGDSQGVDACEGEQLASSADVA